MTFVFQALPGVT